ncbi:NADPH-dependent alcohol dehydrogenase [Pholiota conissans]|uniref:NADPH-dependent alcohol dehydrogenase n=1 Tax=Pholiota conissans TaxID=109636 RepID=A0A9P5ZEG3_9AGAR|nr:NADPH-dependent alcohol dehydrogenase [Pholiota conissans]
MAAELEWKGYAVHDTNNWEKFDVINIKPRPQGDYDVDIKIEYCGVCGSDVHTITGGWGKPNLPVIPGHEIAGVAVRVGPKVTSIKVGDCVGVGAAVCSCMKCKLCTEDNEQYCPKIVFTYNSKYEECGTISTGGYASAIRAHEGFVFPIPDGLKLEEAASMFCGGLTVFSPLVRNGAGHYALQFAKALGSDEVVAFSHSSRKKEDAAKLGATKFVVTGEAGFEEPLHASLDLIICTADVASGISLKELLSTVKPGGHFVMVALPDDEVPALADDLVSKGVYFGGSLLGSKKEVRQMLQLAAEKGVKPWIEVFPMKECGKVVRAVKDGNVRYRNVLK